MLPVIERCMPPMHILRRMPVARRRARLFPVWHRRRREPGQEAYMPQYPKPAWFTAMHHETRCIRLQRRTVS
jgi:hypothetical protein